MATESDPIEQLLNECLSEAHGTILEQWLETGGSRAYIDLDLFCQKAITAIRQEVERICLEIIGPDENAYREYVPGKGNHNPVVTAQNKLRAIQRERLAAALRGLEGK